MWYKKNLRKWFLAWHCISILHDSVGAESWKGISAVASVNPQEDKGNGTIGGGSRQQRGYSFGGDAEHSPSPCLRSSELAFFSDSEFMLGKHRD